MGSSNTPPPGDSGDPAEGPVDHLTGPDQQPAPESAEGPESPPEAPEAPEAEWVGHANPERHRTTGHRAWCQCTTWCSEGMPCWCCEEELTRNRTPGELASCCRAVWPNLDRCPNPAHDWRLHAHPRLVIWSVAADHQAAPVMSPDHPAGSAQNLHRSAAGNPIHLARPLSDFPDVTDTAPE